MTSAASCARSSRSAWRATGPTPSRRHCGATASTYRSPRGRPAARGSRDTGCRRATSCARRRTTTTPTRSSTASSRPCAGSARADDPLGLVLGHGLGGLPRVALVQPLLEKAELLREHLVLVGQAR